MTVPATAVELSQTPVPQAVADWLVVGVWEGEQPSGPAAQLDAAAGGAIARLLSRGDLTGKPFESVALHDLPGVAAPRVLAIGLGKRANATRQTLHDSAAAAARAITGKKVGTVALAVPDAGGKLSAADTLLAVGLGLSQGCYGPGIRKTNPSRFAPDRLVLVAPQSPGFDANAVLARVSAEARAVWLARELVNTPPAELYPETFATRAADLGRSAGFSVEVWDEGRLAAERMNALLAVARGSDRPARLAILRHQGKPGGPTLGLVGKGVTFDSGGMSLKTSDQMVDMKCDMAGGAAVLAGLAAVAELKLPVNVMGVIPLVENMPSGRAMKLGDVLTARNGKTIEVLNTDAEGRLILADALAFAAEQGVGHLVDFATLTGACLVALGAHVAGLMTNDDAWGDRVLAAVGRAGERAWKLPMDSHYDELIKSKVADMRNTAGGRYAGAIGGAKLLQQFVGDTPWVHLDIAGPAWAENDTPAQDPGGTGCMVRTIVELASGYPG